MFAKKFLAAFFAVKAAQVPLTFAHQNSNSSSSFIDVARTPTGVQDITSWAVIVRRSPRNGQARVISDEDHSTHTL